MVCQRKKYVRLKTWGVKRGICEGIGRALINPSSVSPAWVAYLNIGVLIGALALALFNASKDDVARNFAYFYAVVSVGIVVSLLACR